MILIFIPFLNMMMLKNILKGIYNIIILKILLFLNMCINSFKINNNIFSIFEMILNYISLTCKSDSDCPKDSKCIGDKCIVPFYCKKGDKSICAFHYSFCDGKLCFKDQNNICGRHDKNLCDVCNGTCLNKYNEYNYIVDSVDEYSEGYFTYKNAKKYFEKWVLKKKKHIKIYIYFVKKFLIKKNVLKFLIFY